MVDDKRSFHYVSGGFNILNISNNVCRQTRGLFGPTNDLKCIMSATNISVTTVQLRDEKYLSADKVMHPQPSIFGGTDLSTV